MKVPEPVFVQVPCSLGPLMMHTPPMTAVQTVFGWPLLGGTFSVVDTTDRVGVTVAVGADGEGVMVAAAVLVGVAVAVLVRVAALIAVLVGSTVLVLVGLGCSVPVGVLLGVTVSVAVLVGVAVAVLVGVLVRVGVGVAVRVGVGVAVLVGVFVGGLATARFADPELPLPPSFELTALVVLV
jgi:hypothetical protein